MAYAGPAGDPMVAYFTTCGLAVPPLLPHDNLAEWMTRILGKTSYMTQISILQWLKASFLT